MSSDEHIDALLRRTLKQHPTPVCGATLTDDIVRRVANYQSVQRRRARRALLIAYWFASAAGSWWLLRSLPLPAWTPESLSPALAWLIPSAGALLVWRRPIARWTHTLARSTP